MSPPPHFRCTAILTAAALLLLHASAFAQSNTEPTAAETDPAATAREPAPLDPKLDVPLSYRAPAHCPKRDAFLSEVRRRISEPPAPIVDSIAVEITERAGQFNGRLLFNDQAGERSTRNISGERCDEVASALALITALALQAKLPSEKPEPEPEPDPQPGPESVAASASEPEPEPEPSDPEAPRSLRLELGAQVGAAAAYSPNPSLTLRVFGSAVTRHALFRLSLGYATSGDKQPVTGESDFSLLAVRGDICALLDELDTLTAGLCGGFELGYLRAAGTESNSLDARQGGTLWAAPSLQGQLRYAPGRSFRLELAAGAHFPLYREQFI
ncbi:MAG TPA: hypothetical protein VHO25_02320, partial [Polyangiaceae bacterium]|nr:hypothetical protein [Polyangiaceae bacterium]